MLMLFFVVMILYLLMVGFMTVLESKIMGLVQSSISLFSGVVFGIYQFYLDFFKLLVKGVLDKSFIKMFCYSIVIILFLLNNVLMFLWVVMLLCLCGLSFYDMFLLLLLEGSSLVFKIYMFYFMSYKFVSWTESSLKNVIMFLEIVYIYLMFLIIIIKAGNDSFAGSLLSTCFSFNVFMSVMFMFLFMVTLIKMFSTPFDYLECESELVSGLSLEFYGYSFLLWSLVEYSSLLNSILVMGFLFVILFNKGLMCFVLVNIFLLCMVLFVSAVFVSASVESSFYMALNIYCLCNVLMFLFVIL